ncbi:MAG TPA: AMP-binding protein [Ramlibacter sp.]|nr:AMP-binding protein [Ramlibacter sp.]
MTDDATQPFTGARDYPRVHGVGELLQVRVRQDPDRVALHSVDGESWTWSQLAAQVGAVQAALGDHGLARGDHVALFCDNSLRMAAALLAIAAAGLVAVPLNTALVGPGLAAVLAHCDAKLLLADPAGLERCRGLGVIQPCVALDEMFGAKGNLEIAGGGADTALIIYTSGTTGDAKGVVISHAAILNGAFQAAAVMLEATPDTVIHTCLPLFHCAAQQLGLWPALLSGARLVLSPRFSAGSFWDELQACGATAFHFVGPMTSILWKAEPSPNDARQPPRIALGGGPRIAWREFEERFNVRFVECYGMTETFGGCVSHRPGRGRPGTVGKALDSVQVAVDDGQIVVRPRRDHVLFSGYYKRADLTQAAFRDGWYRTGDLGSLDADGFLSYRSRARDIIRRRGENVSALAVEEAAAGCPGIAECGVVGVPSELGEEDILAVFVADGEPPQWEVVLAHLRERLPTFAVPRYLAFAPELPKTVTGRLQRHLLRELLRDAFDRSP